MLDRFFNFQENPFNLTPDPRFFYANPMYQEAYDELSRSLQQSKGYLALTGETGVGKTTLLKTLINGLDKNYRSIYFEYSNLGFDDFLGLACNKLGVATEGKQPQQALREFLLVQSQRGIIIVFFIDEAQNFPPDSLAQILDFTDSLGTERHLLQIVLSGQPQLEAQLALPELHALRDRLALHCRLSPLPGRGLWTLSRTRGSGRFHPSPPHCRGQFRWRPTDHRCHTTGQPLCSGPAKADQRALQQGLDHSLCQFPEQGVLGGHGRCPEGSAG